MAFIEGIGDEVIGLLVAIIIIGITFLLWSSTYVQERVPVVVQVLPQTNQNSTEQIDQQSTSDPNSEESQESLSSDTISPAEEVTENLSQNVPIPENLERTDEHDPIKIRCQFLDETSLHVDTFLSESISGLKTRHLIPHLGLNPSNGDNVRLIFNGRVLQGENQTLEQSGINNNCVIHCLVHRNTPNSQSERTPGINANRNDNGIDVADLDLSNVCYPLLGSVLMAIWWCQVVYAHYFTLTSTLSLVSLTVLYLASAANAYLHN